jgi:hypothetical protein
MHGQLLFHHSCMTTLCNSTDIDGYALAPIPPTTFGVYDVDLSGGAIVIALFFAPSPCPISNRLVQTADHFFCLFLFGTVAFFTRNNHGSQSPRLLLSSQVLKTFLSWPKSHDIPSGLRHWTSEPSVCSNIRLIIVFSITSLI